jgi:hypothetical protein
VNSLAAAIAATLTLALLGTIWITVLRGVGARYFPDERGREARK